MKKYLFLPVCLVSISLVSWCQSGNTKYPEPEFTKEVYLLKKETPVSVLRLEKSASKMESRTKMGGMGGAESGYSIEGEKSPVRLGTGANLSFVYSTGASAGSSAPAKRDSMLQANGIDPSMMQGMGSMMDPSSMITLYRVESGRGKRKILMMKSPGALPFGSKQMKSSDKLTFSLKKLKEGYWELVIDKPLVKGEYAFSMMSLGMGSMDGGTTLFAFGVD